MEWARSRGRSWQTEVGKGRKNAVNVTVSVHFVHSKSLSRLTLFTRDGSDDVDIILVAILLSHSTRNSAFRKHAYVRLMAVHCWNPVLSRPHGPRYSAVYVHRCTAGCVHSCQLSLATTRQLQDVLVLVMYIKQKNWCLFTYSEWSVSDSTLTIIGQ